jgi:hypothetical protein
MRRLFQRGKLAGQPRRSKKPQKATIFGKKLDLEETTRKTHNSTRDFAAESSGVSKRVHQLCVIITEARSAIKRRRRRFTSQPESGGSLCQL